ncbi:MAG: FHA domain-containing protein [Planctomycetota bacterium]|nr:MAG: FHA domain-containing protein [Planctomycetota bacterium]
MQTITLRVISGADRGRVFEDLKPPITIGREEGNMVQLNDERVSRYHVKIQDDNGRLVITDLDSTNGTRVNGQPCNLKILHYGDTISIGRTVLLVGSRAQIGEWFAGEKSSSDRSDIDDSYDFDLSTDLQLQQSKFLSSFNMQLPRDLSPGQAAELREILDRIHRGIRNVVESAIVDEKEHVVRINKQAWQNLLLTQSEVSELIRAIEDPHAIESDSRDFPTGSD